MRHSFSAVIERHIHLLRIEDPGFEEPAATRDRLRSLYPRGAARRMTQLGMLLGSAFDGIDPGGEDAIVYASSYAENRALEEYLASFPSVSPTLFQTSIHPSAVQQAMIGRRQAVGQFFPLTGRAQLVAHAVQTALLVPGRRVVLCGGEERGTWSRAHDIASDRSFAFAVALSSEPAGSLGTLGLESSEAPDGALSLPDFFAALRDRRSLLHAAAPGLTLSLTWR
jgi:hypothetical protein